VDGAGGRRPGFSGGGRWPALIARAAAGGAIDPAASDLLDPKFWRRLRAAVAELERRDATTVLSKAVDATLADLSVAVAAAAAGGGSQLDAASRAVDRSLAALNEHVFPGSGAAAEDAKRSAFAALWAEWGETWGDPDSPETRAKIEEAAARLGPA